MPLSRNPQPSPLLESLSSSFDSVTSLSVFPSALSVSSSSLFVLSSSLSSSHSSLCSTPASIVFLHDRVPLPPSISLFSFPSSLFLSPDSLTVCDPSLVSGSVPVSPPCANDSNIFLSCSHSAEICPDSSVMHKNRFDAVQLSPLDRPPEDPPPDVADELKDWVQAYVGLGILEPALPSASFPLPMPSDSDGLSDFLTPTKELGVDAIPTFTSSRDSDGQDFRSLDSFRSAVVPSTSSDNSCPTFGHSEELSLPAASPEIDALSICFRELCDVVHASRSDTVFLSRVDTIGPSLRSDLAQPMHDSPTLDDKLGYAMSTSTGVVWLADLSPADDYNAQSEPEPPDPSCASH